MKKFFKNSLIILSLLTLVLIPIKIHGMENKSHDEAPIPNSARCNLKMEERRLWIDHVLWTRSVIVSDIASLEDTSPVLERLLKNQNDIGNSIKPYYSEEAGNKLANLLREHINLATKVVDSVKSKNYILT